MAWPSTDVNNTNVDASGDNPDLARVDLKDLIDKFNAVRQFFTTIGQAVGSAVNAAAARMSLGSTTVGDAVFIAANAAAARAAIYASAPNFRATYNSALTLTNARQVVPFDIEGEDVGGNFASGTFTAPVAGLYGFNYGLEYGANSPSSLSVLISNLQVNGSDLAAAGTRIHGQAGSNPDCAVASIFITLAAGDTVRVVARYGFLGATSLQVLGNANTGPWNTYFSGALLR